MELVLNLPSPANGTYEDLPFQANDPVTRAVTRKITSCIEGPGVSPAESGPTGREGSGGGTMR
ncbi:hypothetical protein M407DRAFT_115338 [Tulasnella calospora MUT 4182]|uniref:Uncharacterized protein n=1 Tax=Tulasnella calospora MUT 4182 TaxID=1051891 RepID=A0A0C3QSS8_9AGAM|nr:hypothetical protein M407DRAFT_115338 [Tulasnella calospora MUT 4182]